MRSYLAVGPVATGERVCESAKDHILTLRGMSWGPAEVNEELANALDCDAEVSKLWEALWLLSQKAAEIEDAKATVASWQEREEGLLAEFWGKANPFMARAGKMNLGLAMAAIVSKVQAFAGGSRARTSAAAHHQSPCRWRHR